MQKIEDGRQRTEQLVGVPSGTIFRHDYIGHKCPPTGWAVDYGLKKGVDL